MFITFIVFLGILVYHAYTYFPLAHTVSIYIMSLTSTVLTQFILKTAIEILLIRTTIPTSESVTTSKVVMEFPVVAVSQ